MLASKGDFHNATTRFFTLKSIRKGSAQNGRGGATSSLSDGGGSAAPGRTLVERAAVVVG